MLNCGLFSALNSLSTASTNVYFRKSFAHDINHLMFSEVESEEKEPTPPVKREPSPIPPEFTQSLDDVSPSEGDELILRCMVKGLPDPTVDWLVDGEVHMTRCISN